MKDSGERTIRLYQILKKHTDASHVLSMPQIIAILEEEGIEATRRSVYRSFDALQRCGIQIVYTRTPIQGYYLVHDISIPEAVILANAVRESRSLTETDAERLTGIITSMLSDSQKEQIYLTPDAVSHTDNPEIMRSLSVILEAIHHGCPVSFRYFDYSVTHKKQYRKNRQKYELVPYAAVTSDGRYYAVMYSPSHASFGAYRIDKMENAAVSGEPAEKIPFDLNAWMQSSFRMYRGTPETVTAVFDLSLSSIVFDQFGRDLIISEVSDRTFTASFRSSVTPTLISWILQFPGRITVLKPQSLIERLLEISESIQKTYHGGNYEQ